jgi:hypothetical protein
LFRLFGQLHRLAADRRQPRVRMLSTVDSEGNRCNRSNRCNRCNRYIAALAIGFGLIALVAPC